MGDQRNLFLAAYPRRPHSLFEDVLVKLLPPEGWTIGRFRDAVDVLDAVRDAWKGGTVDLMQLDLFAHGKPGVFGIDHEVPLFDCFAGTCALGGLEKYLHPDAVVRFLGCNVAASRSTASGWTFDPLQGLAWVSSQLGGLRVEAPNVSIGAASFGSLGFGQGSPDLMVAAHRKPTP